MHAHRHVDQAQHLALVVAPGAQADVVPAARAMRVGHLTLEMHHLAGQRTVDRPLQLLQGVGVVQIGQRRPCTCTSAGVRWNQRAKPALA
jgi:hypothetical protein